MIKEMIINELKVLTKEEVNYSNLYEIFVKTFFNNNKEAYEFIGKVLGVNDNSERQVQSDGFQFEALSLIKK